MIATPETVTCFGRFFAYITKKATKNCKIISFPYKLFAVLTDILNEPVKGSKTCYLVPV